MPCQELLGRRRGPQQLLFRSAVRKPLCLQPHAAHDTTTVVFATQVRHISDFRQCLVCIPYDHEVLHCGGLHCIPIQWHWNAAIVVIAMLFVCSSVGVLCAGGCITVVQCGPRMNPHTPKRTSLHDLCKSVLSPITSHCITEPYHITLQSDVEYTHSVRLHWVWISRSRAG